MVMSIHFQILVKSKCHKCHKYPSSQENKRKSFCEKFMGQAITPMNSLVDDLSHLVGKYFKSPLWEIYFCKNLTIAIALFSEMLICVGKFIDSFAAFSALGQLSGAYPNFSKSVPSGSITFLYQSPSNICLLFAFFSTPLAFVARMLKRRYTAPSLLLGSSMWEDGNPT